MAFDIFLSKVALPGSTEVMGQSISITDFSIGGSGVISLGLLLSAWGQQRRCLCFTNRYVAHRYDTIRISETMSFLQFGVGFLTAFYGLWAFWPLVERLKSYQLTLAPAAPEEDVVDEKHGICEQTTDYDCIIRILSLSDFAQTKKIWLLKAGSSDFDPDMDLDVRVISVVGLFNKGKAFLLNKLFGLRLPSGKTQVTQGLSCVYLKERKMLLIDSPGVQSTVSYKSDGADRVVDAQSTETFIFELVSQISDHIIFVVNDFTSFEQLKVQTFEKKELSHTGRAPRELIVVHNLCDARLVEDAEKLFAKQITSRYDGVESHLGKLLYTARRNPPVHHFAICHDGSPAGDIFNHNNFRLLLEHLEHAKKLPERIVLAKLIKQKLDDFVPRFFLKSPVDAGVEYRQCDQMEAIPEEEEPGDRIAYYHGAGYFHIDCERLEVKRQGVISELGEVVSHDKSFNPEPAIYDEKREEYLRRTIQIECPGVRVDQVKWEEDGGCLSIKIEKSRLLEEGSVTTVEGFPLRQQSGVWEKEFRFIDGPFELCEDESYLENGVLKVCLKKSLMKRRGGLLQAGGPPVTYYAPSSLPSEPEGVRHVDPDAHPSQSLPGTVQTMQNQNGNQHCLTSTSWVLTSDGPKTAAALASESPEVPQVASVALTSNAEDADAENGQGPKNGLSPA